jgi:Uma2 family endonuclease
MPPSADEQALISSDLQYILVAWARHHPEFLVSGNEAGLLIDDEVRGAEGFVRRRDSTGGSRRGFLRVPPILAVEVAGEDQHEPALLVKARWYLKRGVEVVWLVLPATREVVVVLGKRRVRRRSGQYLPAHRSLPGLQPDVDDFFRQLQ